MKVWVSEANKLRDLLPSEVQATLLKHEANSTTDDPAYKDSVTIFYDRHVCRIPQPQCLVDSFAQLANEPTVYHTMNGPSEFHVIGSLKDWDIRDGLGKINVPTLLVSGQFDEATPAMVSEIQSLIPGSTWELFPESSHTPHIEEPARFKRIIGDWLDSHA
jgi:L-proline amide hydrolase